MKPGSHKVSVRTFRRLRDWEFAHRGFTYTMISYPTPKLCELGGYRTQNPRLSVLHDSFYRGLSRLYAIHVFD